MEKLDSVNTNSLFRGLSDSLRKVLKEKASITKFNTLNISDNIHTPGGTYEPGSFHFQRGEKNNIPMSPGH